MAFGGQSPGYTANTELWNGTNWTEVNNLNTARAYMAGAGTSTSALGFGGSYPPSQLAAQTEDWNGTNWTETSDLSTGRYGLGGSGTSTLALAFGGYTTTAVANTEEWSGSSTVTKTIDTD